MRVVIMSDMEGVSGITTWEQVSNGEAAYEEARVLYTQEVNAAIRGAKAGGADEVVVIDFHGAGGPRSFNSYVGDLLEPDCTWVAHHAWLHYEALLEQPCDAVLIVGAHARMGTPDGVLCHTVSSTSWRNLWFNGELVGETALNAAWWGHHGVPVLMVAGDAAACREARAALGDGLTTVQVKRGLSRYSAQHVPPVRARQMIAEGATKALQNLKAVRPYVPARPTTVAVEFASMDKLQEYKGRPGVEVIESEVKVVSRGEHWLQAWSQLWDW